ncbi:MAG TPA: hypothetical protein VIP53_00470 [Nitrososphaera sp.]
MPHIVLSGSIQLGNTFKQMNKMLFKDQKSNVIVRIENFFINQRCDIILSKAIAIDQKTQSFYIVVMNRENKITIRLDPITDPEKTDGVKIALALMAKRIQDIEKISDLYVSKTNIQEFIDRLHEFT